MRETILSAAALILLSSAVIAQSVDTKSAPPTGPAAQSHSTSKSDASKGNMTKKKMSKSATTRKTGGQPGGDTPRVTAK
jgi:hypothetical protein